jgi:hypothetical protein
MNYDTGVRVDLLEIERLEQIVDRPPEQEHIPILSEYRCKSCSTVCKVYDEFNPRNEPRLLRCRYCEQYTPHSLFLTISFSIPLPKDVS